MVSVRFTVRVSIRLVSRQATQARHMCPGYTEKVLSPRDRSERDEFWAVPKGGELTPNDLNEKP